MSMSSHDDRSSEAAPCARRAFAEGYGSVAGIFAAPPPPMPRVRLRASLREASADTLRDLAHAFSDVPRPDRTSSASSTRR
jgi:hypothetical protein